MNNVVRVGIGVMIIDNGKVLLGHRLSKRSDTGGIQEPDCWSLPGGKQEMFETMFEGAKREIKEETNLDIDELELFGATDDIAKDRHFVTLHSIAKSFSGEIIAMDPEKEDKWEWFNLNKLPENISSPSKKFIDNYINKQKGSLKKSSDNLVLRLKKNANIKNK